MVFIKDEAERKLEMEKYEDEMALEATRRLKSIRPWSDFGELDVQDEQRKVFVKNHNERLSRLREQKDYQ